MNELEKMKVLVALLNDASDAYYNGLRESPLTDAEFDAHMVELKKLEETTGVVLANSPTRSVGATIVDSISKVEHGHPMLSLDKCHSAEELIDFASDDNCYLSVKCDGLTVSACWRDGQLVSAATRGNGYVGQDVLFHFKNFSNVPLTIPYKDELVVDGEAVIFEDDFQKINNNLPEDKKFKNSRNLASGTLATLDGKTSQQRHMKFVAWRVIKGFDDIDSNFFKLKEVEQLGFTIPPIYTYTNHSSDKENIESMLHDLRGQARKIGLPMDGVVMAKDSTTLANSMGRTDKFFYHSIAYKFDDEKYETRLLDIDWTVGRTGKVTPTAVFEPIEIDGSIVERASMHNISIMNELTDGRPFYRGLKLDIFKANAIIPQVQTTYWDYNGFMNAEKFDIPVFCPCCGEKLTRDNTDGSLICKNSECAAKKLAQFSHFVSRNCMNIVGLSDRTLEMLISHGFVSSFVDIYSLNTYKDEIEKLEGMGKKSVEKLLESIDESKNVRLDNFIAALGIETIGLSNAKTIANRFNYNAEEFLNACKNHFDFSILDGIGQVMDISIHRYMKENFDMVVALAGEMNFVAKNVVQPTSNPFSGKKVCVTGTLINFTRNSINEYLTSLGAKPVGSVSKTTDYLICNEASTSSKYKKATELGIPVISEILFQKMVDGEV